MEQLQPLYKGRIDLAVCILFYEKLEQTIECIKSFLPAGINIYILNNGSSLLSRESLGRFYEEYRQIKIFDSDVNLGVGGGRNYLISHTYEEWLLFVDNDITVKTDDWLKRFIHHVSLNKEVEVFIPRMFVVHTNTYAKAYSLRVAGNTAFIDKILVDDSVNTFPGGASFINRKVFTRLGLYDDKIFVGNEDFEMSLRGILSRQPIKGRLIHDIELVHDHRPAVNRADKNAARVRYNLKSIEMSYKRITKKHGITFRDYSTTGTVYNLEYMLNYYNPLSQYFWKRLIPNPVKRTLKDLYARFRRIAIPTACTLFMTDTCNFKCHGCRRSVVEVTKSNEMTLGHVQRLLDLYPSINRFCVAGYGEPTLCANFVEIVGFLKVAGKNVTIVTNGTNLSNFAMLAYDPDCISISLYGYNDEQYLSYVGSAVFDKVIGNFLKLKERFKNVGISYIVSRDNYKDLGGILSLCDEIKPTFVDLHNYLVYDPDNKDETSKVVTVKDRDIIEYIRSVSAGRNYRINMPVYIDLDRPAFRCRSYDYVINLDGRGNIGGCQRQLPPDSRFGNIFSSNDPYNFPEMCRLRKIMHKRAYIHKECSMCFGNWRKE